MALRVGAAQTEAHKTRILARRAGAALAARRGRRSAVGGVRAGVGTVVSRGCIAAADVLRARPRIVTRMLTYKGGLVF